jgi:hypothetical protein
VRFAPLIVSAISFAVYLKTLMPGIAFGDWGEMQTIPHVLGVAHPSGYPTYVVLAWLAQLVPIGTVAFRANLLSAVLVALSLGVFTVIAGRLGARPVIAAASALAFGAIGTVWAAATVAEVNPLHLLLVALILNQALVWQERRRLADFAIGGLLIGLAAGNHLMTVMVVPFIGLFALWTGRRELLARPVVLLAAAGACLVGLCVYLYIPLAASTDTPLQYNDPTTAERLLYLLSGSQYGGKFDFLRSSGPATFLGYLPALGDIAVARSSAVIPMLGAAGLAVLVRRRTAFGLTLVAILGLGIYVWANYQRLEHYLLVPWLVVALGAAVAVEALATQVERLAAARRPSWGASSVPGAFVGGLAIVGVVVLAASIWPSADRSSDRSGERFSAAVFGALPKDAVILSEFDATTPLWHGQHVRGERPDVLIVDDTNVMFEGWASREARIASVICDRPVFIIRMHDHELAPTRAAFELSPFLSVRVGVAVPSADVPTATTQQQVYLVEPLPGTCGTAGRSDAPAIGVGSDSGLPD